MNGRTIDAHTSTAPKTSDKIVFVFLYVIHFVSFFSDFFLLIYWFFLSYILTRAKKGSQHLWQIDKENQRKHRK